jgi:hypothetical protein
MTIKKLDKTREIAEAGGVDIKYGVKIKGDQMTFEALRNMPVFYLDISDKEYRELSQNEWGSDTVTKTELRIFNSFIRSLAIQRSELLLVAEIAQDAPVRRKIDAFEQDTLAVFASIYHKRKAEIAT